MPYNREVYLAAAPAFSTASQNAKRNRAPYGMLLTTTPGDLLTDSGAYAYDIRNKATPWIENYYDFTYQQSEELKNSNTNNSFFMISYTSLGTSILMSSNTDKALKSPLNQFLKSLLNAVIALSTLVLISWS